MRGQVAAATDADDHRDQRHGDVGGLAREQVLDDLLAAGGRQVRVGQRLTQLVGALEHAGEPEQLVGHLVELLLVGRDGQQRLGVAVDPVLGSAVVGHEPISLCVWFADSAERRRSSPGRSGLSWPSRPG